MTFEPDRAQAADCIWRTVRSEAQAIATKEPFLVPLLESRVLNPQSASQAFTSLLADLLATEVLDRNACLTLFDSLVSDAPNFAQAMCKDLAAVKSRDPACPTYVHAFMNNPGFQALQGHRVAHQAWTQGRHELAAWIANQVSTVLGPDIHPAARLGSGIMLDHGAGIVIGETAVVEDDVTILQNVTLGGTGKEQGDRHPKIRQGVMIGAGANIIGNIEIGAFSKVGAGSVVLKDVPPGCTMAGAPAQIVRIHEPEPKQSA